MDKYKLEQEDYCLQVKELCNILRTRILEIDDFPDKQRYFGQLKKIKDIAEGVYWKV